jgi:glycerophosphoryl diester phosphodiesterase
MKFLELFNKTGLISAHRGARSTHPENTLRALVASIGRCDFIEIDVQLSSDGVPVIMHDDTLERTTNVRELDKYKSREPYNVYDFSYEELAELDYGTWFYKTDPFEEIKKGNVDTNIKQYEPLFTLNDLLSFIKRNQVFVNIEIKDMHENFSDVEVISTIQEKIEKVDIEDFIIFSSFRHEYLPLCKQKMQSVPTAALVEDKQPDDLVNYLKELDVDAYNLDDVLVDEQTIKKVKDEGFFVNIYTVNDKKRQKELFDMGVNGVFTDFL